MFKTQAPKRPLGGQGPQKVSFFKQNLSARRDLNFKVSFSPSGVLGREPYGEGGMGREAAEDNLVCALMFCASFHRTRNAAMNVLKLSGRRAAMKLTKCAGMLKHKKRDWHVHLLCFLYELTSL